MTNSTERSVRRRKARVFNTLPVHLMLLSGDNPVAQPLPCSTQHTRHKTRTNVRYKSVQQRAKQCIAAQAASWSCTLFLTCDPFNP